MVHGMEAMSLLNRKIFMGEKMKKSLGILIVVVLILSLMFTSCMTLLALWPDVNEPIGDNSMLIVEAGIGNPAESESLFNSNFTGWAPWVIDDKGDLVPFRPFDIEGRLDSFFYSDNLGPGTYTMKGFLHVYTDYSRLDDSIVASYGPFNDYPYHIKQYLPIDEEVEISLSPKSIQTFGRYFINFSHVGGMSGTTDDRWKVIESSVLISGDKNDKKALRVAKNWKTPNWILWNEYNSELAADE